MSKGILEYAVCVYPFALSPIALERKEQKVLCTPSHILFCLGFEHPDRNYRDIVITSQLCDPFVPDNGNKNLTRPSCTNLSLQRNALFSHQHDSHARTICSILDRRGRIQDQRTCCSGGPHCPGRCLFALCLVFSSFSWFTLTTSPTFLLTLTHPYAHRNRPLTSPFALKARTCATSERGQ